MIFFHEPYAIKTRQHLPNYLFHNEKLGKKSFYVALYFGKHQLVIIKPTNTGNWAILIKILVLNTYEGEVMKLKKEDMAR